MIERNKHPAGRVSNILFGLCAMSDGLVRVLSLGFLHTRITLEYTRKQAQKALDRKKRQIAKSV